MSKPSASQKRNVDIADVSVGCETAHLHRGKWRPGECVGARGTVWEEPGFHLYPFDDMFYPFDPNTTSFKSLVLVTAGRAGGRASGWGSGIGTVYGT